MVNLEYLFKDNQILLLVIPKINYIEQSLQVIEGVERVGQKICYVALNKPYNAVLSMITKKGMQGDKFFFIDLTASSE